MEFNYGIINIIFCKKVSVRVKHVIVNIKTKYFCTLKTSLFILFKNYSGNKKY